jgi:hypothetical protein
MRLAERRAGGPCGPTGASRGGWGSGGGGFWEDAVRYCLDEGSLPLDELNYTFSTRSRL